MSDQELSTAISGWKVPFDEIFAQPFSRMERTASSVSLRRAVASSLWPCEALPSRDVTRPVIKAGKKIGRAHVLTPVTVKSLITSFFFFNDTATTEIYPLSLHDALPI